MLAQGEVFREAFLSKQYLWSHRQRVVGPRQHFYSPITVVSPPSQVGGGWRLWRGFTTAAVSLEETFALHREFLLHICVVLIWDCPCIKEVDNCPVQISNYAQSPTNLVEWSIIVIATLSKQVQTDRWWIVDGGSFVFASRKCWPLHTH